MSRIDVIVSTRCAVGALSIFLASMAWSSGSWSQSNPWPIEPTKEELAILPAYCMHVQTGYGETREGYASWSAVYGPLFAHMHHYCYAFVYLLRASRHATPAPLRSHYLSNAFLEIQYVIQRSPPDGKLIPELLTKQGNIRRRQDKTEDAIKLLNRAIEIDPTYWRAYLELATCHHLKGRPSEALEVLRAGLTHSPDAKALALMLNELDNGGRPPR